jgi:hypothetical protein
MSKDQNIKKFNIIIDLINKEFKELNILYRYLEDDIDGFEVCINRALVLRINKDMKWTEIKRYITSSLNNDMTCGVCYDDIKQPLIQETKNPTPFRKCCKCTFLTCLRCSLNIAKNNNYTLRCPQCCFEEEKDTRMEYYEDIDDYIHVILNDL